MIPEYIEIKNRGYLLHTHYQNNEKLRLEFNRMTREFWGFDFENYYQSGYWQNNCILYSLFDDDKIVSHVTVSLLQHEEKTLMQLGTVMTDKDYQKQGLNRYLMGRVKDDLKGQIDGTFLFANETVLDYYPKFGFAPVSEAEHFLVKKNTEFVQQYKRQKLDLENKIDLNLFEMLVSNSISNSKFQTKNKGLSLFYCYAYPEMGFKDAVYFIEELSCAVITQLEGRVLHIVEVFASGYINLDVVIGAFSDLTFDEVVFGFTPKQTRELQFRNYKEEDLVLFVSSELQVVFNEDELRINSLSHT